MKLFTKTATLDGQSDPGGVPVSLSIRVDLIKENDEIMVMHLISLKSLDDEIVSKGTDSPYSHRLYDLFEFSLCLQGLQAALDLRTEIERDSGSNRETFLAQLSLYQNLFSVCFAMFCKDTKKFTGMKFIDLFIPCYDLTHRGLVYYRRIIAQEKNIASFSKDVYDIWTTLNSAILNNVE